jgi:hypothetical protein
LLYEALAPHAAVDAKPSRPWLRAVAAVAVCVATVAAGFWILNDPAQEVARASVAGLPLTEAAAYSRAYYLAVPGRVEGFSLGNPAQALAQNQGLLHALNHTRADARDAEALLLDQQEALKWFLATGADATKAEASLHDPASFGASQAETVKHLESARDAIASLARRAEADEAAYPLLREGFGLDGGFAGLTAYTRHQAALWEAAAATALEEATPYSTYFQHPPWRPSSLTAVEGLLAEKTVRAGIEQAATSVPWTLEASNITESDAAAVWLAGAWSLGASQLRLQVFWGQEPSGPVFHYCAQGQFPAPRSYCPTGGLGSPLLEVAAPDGSLGVLRNTEPTGAEGNVTILELRNGSDRALLDVETVLRPVVSNDTAAARVVRVAPQGMTAIAFRVSTEGPAVLEVRSQGRLVLQCHLYLAPGAGAVA